MKRLLLIFLLLLSVAILSPARHLRVLAIGNSFSADAVEDHLWPLAAELGDTLIIGNAYNGGCDIDRHVNNLSHNKAAYEYRKVVGGKLSNAKEYRLRDIIQDEPWDIITLQQVSGKSGMTDSYRNLPILIDSVKALMPNKEAELVWHRTWSYAKDYHSDLYKYYGENQKRMDDSIAAVSRTVPSSNGMVRQIPSGIAVSNARLLFGDSLNRDGFHLAIPLGRYVAGAAWAEFLTGKDVTKCTYVPDGLTEEEAQLARQAAHFAFSQRPDASERLFYSQSIEDEIVLIKSLLTNPKLAWMFENCFPNTLDTTVFFVKDENGDDDTFVITGDIPAMWLRDSAAQVWPYVRFATQDPTLQAMIRGVIRRQLRSIILDPYANAFNKGADGGMWQSDFTDMIPEVHERKWEIDSLCYPLRLAYEYWKKTGDASIFDEIWLEAVDKILTTFIEQQRKEGNGPYTFRRNTDRAYDTLSNNGLGTPIRPVGLIASSFRPSDDATTLQFLVPSNFFAVTSLRKAAQILTQINKDSDRAEKCKALADEVEKALKEYAVYNHPVYGEIYAYEVDGFGNRLLMDDANVPSLLAMPYLEDVDVNDPIYQNTRRFVWSESNPYFFRGSAGEGIGGPHVGYRMAWPMSIMMKAFTSTDDNEIRDCLKMLLDTDAGLGFMHESFNVDNPTDFTRPWFAWQNTLFGELIIKLVNEGKLDLLNSL